MVEAYCFKCKKKCELIDVEVSTTKNNRLCQKGACIECGCKSNRFIKKEKSENAKKLETLLE